MFTCTICSQEEHDSLCNTIGEGSGEGKGDVLFPDSLLSGQAGLDIGKNRDIATQTRLLLNVFIGLYYYRDYYVHNTFIETIAF